MKAIRQISMESKWSENQLAVAASATTLRPATKHIEGELFHDTEIALILATAESMFADVQGKAGGEWIETVREPNDIEG